jgi:hypothetical protein
MSSLTLWLCVVLMAGSVAAKDVPFIFDEMTSDVEDYTSSQIEQVQISSPQLVGIPPVIQALDNETLVFPVTGGGSTPLGTTERKVGELKTVLNSRVEPENPLVHEKAVLLTAEHSGDFTIDQIGSIYHYLKYGENSIKNWSYSRDPRGTDYFNYANASLKIGNARGCAGAGDCDDFAILMAALVESIGGTTRIILASNNITGGHAYAEVYLGRFNTSDSQVEDIIGWLRQEYNTDKIYTHIDTDTKDVWLNLDWGPDERGNAHPGGPFFQGDKHIVVCIREELGKTPIKIPENFKFQEMGMETIKTPLPSRVSSLTDYTNRSADIEPELENPFDRSNQLPTVHQSSQVPGSDYIPLGTQPISLAKPVNVQ